MKKVFYTLIAALSITVGAYAQTPDVHFGFKGGYNLSSLGGDVQNNKSISGFHLGGFVEIPVSQRFAIQPEVLYSRQGSKFDYGYLNDDAKLKLDYINVPIFAKYYINEGLSVEAGPQIGFLVKGELDSNNVDVDIKDNLKTVDVALGVGLAYKLNSGLFFSGRYNFGLTNIGDDNSIYSAGLNKAKNNALQVSVGYRF